MCLGYTHCQLFLLAVAVSLTGVGLCEDDCGQGALVVSERSSLGIGGRHRTSRMHCP